MHMHVALFVLKNRYSIMYLNTKCFGNEKSHTHRETDRQAGTKEKIKDMYGCIYGCYLRLLVVFLGIV